MYYSFRPEADFFPEQWAQPSGFSSYYEPALSGFTESCDARPKAQLFAGLGWLQSSSFSSPQTGEEDSRPEVLAELTTDVELSVPGRPAHTHPVTDILVWVERLAVMAAIHATRFPEKAPEFFTNMATIVRAERNYEGERWVVYDSQFRREALAHRDLNWSATDQRLYNEVFTGRAKCIARCGYCLRDDHTTRSCPTNPSRTALGGSSERPAWPQPGTMSHKPGSGRSQETCRKFNELRYKFPTSGTGMSAHTVGNITHCQTARSRPVLAGSGKSQELLPTMRGRAQGQLAPRH